MSGQLTPQFPHIGSHIDFLGGLLADEMGLGKTILLLTLIGISKLFSSTHQELIVQSQLSAKINTNVKIMENLDESDFNDIERKNKRRSLFEKSKRKIRMTGRSASKSRKAKFSRIQKSSSKNRNKSKEAVSKKKSKSGRSVSRNSNKSRERSADFDSKSESNFGAIGMIKNEKSREKRWEKIKESSTNKKKSKFNIGNQLIYPKKKKLGGLAGNLIVMPTMLLSQWAEEIENFFKKVENIIFYFLIIIYV